MGSWTRRNSTFVVSLAVLAAACAVDQSLAPHRRSRETALRQLTGDAFSLPVPANSAAPLEGGVPWFATGIMMRRGVNVRMRMPQTLSATFRAWPEPPPSSGCEVPNLTPPSPGWVAEVTPNYKPQLGPPYEWIGAVRYTITPDAAGTVGSNPQRWGGWNRAADGSWTGVVYHGNESPDSGYLSFERHQLDGECEGWVKYDLSGSQTITVDFPEIQVARTPAFVVPGSTVRFAAVASGFAVAASQWFWEWQGPGGPVQVAACLGQSVCDYAPTASGFVIASAVDAEGFVYRGQSDSVEVVRCPTPDSLLNNPAFRAVLRQALDSSGNYDRATDRFLTVDSARRELAGFVTRNKTTGAVSFRAATIVANTPCSVDYTISVPLTDSLLAVWHTHPFRPGGTWSGAEKLPKNCDPRVAGKQYDPKQSDGDWLTAVSIKRRSYAIDSKYVHVIDGADSVAADSTKWSALKKRYDWNTNKCKW